MKTHHTAIDFGKLLMRGFLLEAAWWLACIVFLTVIAGGIALAFGIGLDDTDNRLTGDRSGMRLRTDAGTGCQYLETSDGAITPRRRADGRQVCR